MTGRDEYEFIDFGSHDDSLSSVGLVPCSVDGPSNAFDERLEEEVTLISEKSDSAKEASNVGADREKSAVSSIAEQRKQYKHTTPAKPNGLLDRINRSIRLFRAVCHDHSPFASAGRNRIKDFVRRSGPAYQLPGSPTQDDVQTESYTGWRMGALLNMIVLTVCFCVEIAMLTIAVVADRRESDSSLDGVLYSGSCRTTSRLSTAISLLVNVIATITIGSSNYMMQCLDAPSGPEIREAHSRGYFLQIGVSSPFNIAHISRSKMVLWWIMGLSSLPVHLLFNSAFFATLQANNYALALFTSDFQDPALWSNCSGAEPYSWSRLACDLYENSTSSERYERLDNPEACIKRYSDPLINQYSNVILVSSLESSQRNEILKSIWSHEIAVENSTFTFTTSYSPTGSGSLEQAAKFDSLLTDLTALLGVFTAYEYSEWDNDYRAQLDWILAGTILSQAVSKATYPNGTVLNGSVFEDYVLDGEFSVGTVFEVTLSDGTVLSGSVSNDTVHNGSFVNGTAPIRPAPAFDPTGWLCHDNYTSPCSTQAALQNKINWRASPYGIPISYCLSQKTQREMCQLKYSSVILGIVMGCDVLKILVIFFALRSVERPLVTTGDVITYFLQHPEPFTEKRCLLDQQTVKSGADPCWSESCFPIDFSLEVKDGTIADSFYGTLPSTWKPQRMLWSHAVSPNGWGLLYLVIILGFLSWVTVFGFGLTNVISLGGGGIWRKGLFSPDPNAVFSSTSSYGSISAGSFLRQVMIVNSPQLFFSFMYIMYNGIFTAMHCAEEWSGFATERKPLRVSSPGPGQRSSYWLNLPWSYSLPLIAISALLHWLVSRSLYLVNINVLGPYGTLQEEQTIFACGYSTLMMMLVLATLILLMAIIFGFSRRPLRGEIPLVGTNSLALSAVCHHPNDSATEAYKPLLWGVVIKPEDGQPGHCTLSSREVDRLVSGQKYW